MKGITMRPVVLGLVLALAVSGAVTGCKKSENETDGQTNAGRTASTAPGRVTAPDQVPARGQSPSSQPPAATAPAKQEPRVDASIPPNTLAAPLTPSQASSRRRVLTQRVFTCDNNASFNAQFMINAVNLVFSKGELYMPQKPMASGFRYAGNHYELTGKGTEARLLMPDGKTLNCRAK